MDRGITMASPSNPKETKKEKCRMSLLRASEFCRRRALEDALVGENDNSDDSCNSDDAKDTDTISSHHHQQQSVPVHLEVLPDADFSKRLQALDLTTTTTISTSKIRAKDIHHTALLSSTLPLRDLSLVQGSFALLNTIISSSNNSSRQSNHPKPQNNLHQVLVNLLIVDSSAQQQQQQQHGGKGQHHPKEEEEDIPTNQIQISSTLAATLGLAKSMIFQQYTTRTTTTSTPLMNPTIDATLEALPLTYSTLPLPPTGTASFRITTTTDKIPCARLVTLQCLGRPLFLATTDAIVWPPPPDGIVIRRSSLLQVQDPVSKQPFFYHVMDITPSVDHDHGDNPSSEDEMFFQTTRATIYEFTKDSNNDADHQTTTATASVCPRLPLQIGICPHPDLAPLTKALWGISTRTSPTERVFPIVGTDTDHDVRRLVQATAATLGMQCLSVPGLAAFAAANGHNVTTGSIIPDQLEGLQLALEQAKACRPCILHLVDLDLEFASHRHDPSLREEQEHRIWSVIMDALDPTLYKHQQNSAAANNDNNANTTSADTPSNGQKPKRRSPIIGHTDDVSGRFAPSVLIVISTTQPMIKTSPTGPLVHNLIYDPIHLSYPDASYGEYLWKECDRRRQAKSTPKNQGDVVDVESIQGLLSGRPVHDICMLHEQWYSNCNNKTCGDTKGDQREEFWKLCQALDHQRRTQAPKNSASMVQIAQVKWEDVGGLAQVRQEIMDTIELPLLYPHFFPHGGRSGILLYGPPGTGKTLVAKAVATECNIPFLSVKGPELLGSYVGESEANVRAVFANAREAAMTAGSSGNREAPPASQSTIAMGDGKKKTPTKASSTTPPKACLVFFDELDSLAPRRDDTASGSGGGVMDRVVATLAAELDKGQQQPNSSSNQKDSKKAESCYIFVLGATNRPDLLDPALLRPNRFDRMVYLGVASTPEDRARILAAQIRHLTFEHGRTPQDIADSIVGSLPDNLTGADLSSIGSGALSRATQRLCAKADQEVARRLQEAKEGDDKDNVDSDADEEELAMLDEVLSEWDDRQLAPVVTIEDLLAAAQDVIPSVSHAELERYERLRHQFSSS